MTSRVPEPHQAYNQMVSHPDIAERPLAAPRASSVSSHASTSNRRHHRHGRSHHGGGSSYQTQNEFPFFAQTGDVEIVISAGGQEKRYLLHRLILAQCSGFFDAGLSDEWLQSQAQNNTQASVPDMALARIGETSPGPSQTTVPATAASFRGRPQPRQRWRYELDWEHAEEDEEPMLIQRTPSSGSIFGGDFAPTMPPPAPRTKPPASHSGGFFRSMANLTLGPSSNAHTAIEPPMNETIRDYDNLFRIFYNYPPALNSTNIAQAYTECKALLTLADMYDALPVTGPRVDHHLLRFSSRLFKQIAKYPPSYLKLGYLARSRIIFTEALIHVVGQWPLALPHLRNSGVEVPESVIELIEDKVDELEETKAKVEAKLFRLTLTTSRGERVNPSNAYLDWLAVSLFRQWLAENTTPLPQPILKNSTATPPRLPIPNQNQNGLPNQQALQSQPPPPPYQTQPPIPPLSNTSRIFRLLGSSNPQAYLSHEELKRFLKLNPLGPSTPPPHSHSHHHHSSSRSRRDEDYSTSSTAAPNSLYSREVLRKFERKIDEVKNLARDIVKPLMRNYLELDLREFSGNSSGNSGSSGSSGGLGWSHGSQPTSANAGGAGVNGSGAGIVGGGGGLGYLTCTKVEDDELPWFSED